MKSLCLSLALLLAPGLAPAAGRGALPKAGVDVAGGEEARRVKWRIAELEGEVAALRRLAQEQRGVADARRMPAPGLAGPVLAAVGTAPLAGLLGALAAMPRRGRRRARVRA